MKEKIKTNITLKKKIFNEYVYIALTTIFIYFFVETIYASLLGDDKWIDGIGFPLVNVLLFEIVSLAIL